MLSIHRPPGRDCEPPGPLQAPVGKALLRQSEADERVASPTLECGYCLSDFLRPVGFQLYLLGEHLKVCISVRCVEHWDTWGVGRGSNKRKLGMRFLRGSNGDWQDGPADKGVCCQG